MSEESKKPADEAKTCEGDGPTASADQATQADHDCAKQKADESAAKFNQLPSIDFSTFVYSMATQAMVLMGEMKLPGQEGIPVDLPSCKQTIDIIEMLEKKTKGNLSEAEDKLINNLLYDLRLRYVKATRNP